MKRQTKIEVLKSLKECVSALSKIAEEHDSIKSSKEAPSQYIDMEELKKLAGIS